ncbi:MAG: vanadium-dependent haloperoxidase [Bacteroidia bacterium]|nr:vanadium-dependent haloperoxidase [Bacteroidia bacterium]
MRLWFIFIGIVAYGLTGGQSLRTNENNEFAENVFHLSEVMLHDVANPPAAGRFYAYCALAAYEVTIADQDDTNISSHFRTDPAFVLPKVFPGWSKSFCAQYAMLEVGRKIMPSGYLLEENQKKLINLYKQKYKLVGKQLEANKMFAINIADQVVKFASDDGYQKLSTLTRYRPTSKEEGRWYPTPPEYMGAIEPEWKTIRTFFLDSANQFVQSAPAKFSQEKESSFYRQMKEVYDTTKRLSSEQKEIANFWDCNPFAVSFSGHMSIGLKKISPGGHWMGITGIVCNQKRISFDSTVLIHAMVALTLHDAFVSCWDEKYRSDRIRPETVINKYLDPTWRPLLQTPPFPEYTSGHSVISTASAEILTYYFGGNLPFVDTSEEFFGLNPRSFQSFRQASGEAAISRLYGGIHFRDAIEVGQQQGRSIGNFILGKIKGN